MVSLLEALSPTFLFAPLGIFMASIQSKGFKGECIFDIVLPIVMLVDARQSLVTSPINRHKLFPTNTGIKALPRLVSTNRDDITMEAKKRKSLYHSRDCRNGTV